MAGPVLGPVLGGWLTEAYSWLRAGMSLGVKVDTGHARGLPHFLAALFGRAQRGA
jgi:hypothetical protein